MLNKKIKTLLIGTNNKGKLKEIRNLLPKYVKTYSTSDFKLKSPIENGVSFKENSLIKSRFFSKNHFPDSVICLVNMLSSENDEDLIETSFRMGFKYMENALFTIFLIIA